MALPAAASASPGALNVLVTSNCSGTPEDLAAAIAAKPGVASATFFETGTGTPTAADLASRDVVVSSGDTCKVYEDAALWGDRLADFADAGGVVVQVAYDNWEEPGAHPLGRFASGGYAPLALGPNDNAPTQLGEILAPSSPLVQSLGAFPSNDNTTTALAAGATLLARWADGRDAIAVKGRVVATSATAGDTASHPAISQLVVNAGNHMGRRTVTVTKRGGGRGKLTGSPGPISCGAVCSSPISFGESITLSANAGPLSKFVGWTGACTGTGTCTVTHSGSDIAVGARFSPAFGTRTAVSLRLASRRIPASGPLLVKVVNRNPFRVAGRLGGTAVDVPKSMRSAKLKRKQFSIGAKRSKVLGLSLPRRLRAALAAGRKLRLSLRGTVTDPAGQRRRLAKTLIVAPRS